MATLMSPIHDADTAAIAQQLTVPLELQKVPELNADRTMLGGLTYAVDENGESVIGRYNLVFFDRNGELAPRLVRRVKDFEFAPDGSLVASVELSDGTPLLVVITGDYMNGGSNVEIRDVREFDSYETLPTDIAVSPDTSELAYTHLEHLYTLPLDGSEDQRQMTTPAASPSWTTTTTRIQSVCSPTTVKVRPDPGRSTGRSTSTAKP